LSIAAAKIRKNEEKMKIFIEKRIIIKTKVLILHPVF